MRKFNYLLALCTLALLLAACAEGPEFRSDTLESTTEVKENLGDRGVDSCTVIREMEESSQLKELAFPLYNVTRNRQSLEAFTKKLADKFIGDRATRRKSEGKIVYESNQKLVRLDLEDSEITFVDQSETKDFEQTIDKRGVIEETRKFVREFSELGATSDYYVDRVMGGTYTEYEGITRGGEKTSGKRQSSGEIIIRKVKEKLPLLGGVGSIRFSVRPDRSVQGFKIKFLAINKADGEVKGAELLNYSGAEKKARQSLDKDGKDGASFTFSCEFGYIPDTMKGIPSKLVPGYILHGTAPDTKSVLVVVPALPNSEVITGM